MTYAYRILSPGLHDTANAAISWFIVKWGLRRSRIDVEAPFDPDISFRPTFVVQLDDGHLLCIDVSPHIYSPTLDSVALAALRKGLPVKLYVAVPKDVTDPDYPRKLKQAKLAGVGVIEVDHQSGTIINTAVSLSLVGLRPLRLEDFPSKYRQALQHADQTFRDGEPSKACALVYDELEGCFRRFAKKCVAKKLWKNKNGLNLDVDPWARILDDIDKSLDRSDPVTRNVKPALVARIKGTTTHRNDSGHRPKNLRDLIKRDQALRTRFEGGVDLFFEFVDATRAWRL